MLVVVIAILNKITRCMNPSDSPNFTIIITNLYVVRTGASPCRFRHIEIILEQSSTWAIHNVGTSISTVRRMPLRGHILVLCFTLGQLS